MSGPRTSPPRDLRVFELSENDLETLRLLETRTPFASWLPRKIKYYTLSFILKHLLALVRCIAQFFKSREVEGSIPAHKSERKKTFNDFQNLNPWGWGWEVYYVVSSKKIEPWFLINVPQWFLILLYLSSFKIRFSWCESREKMPVLKKLGEWAGQPPSPFQNDTSLCYI